ncbi:MAG: hypothetical protein ABR568_04945 [Pyrinomonadaceae bacterium]
MDGVLGSGDSAGVAGEVAVAGTDAGTGVEDATGTGEGEAGGGDVLNGWAGGLPTGVCAKAVIVKKLSALSIRKSRLIGRQSD